MLATPLPKCSAIVVSSSELLASQLVGGAAVNARAAAVARAVRGVFLAFRLRAVVFYGLILTQIEQSQPVAALC